MSDTETGDTTTASPTAEIQVPKYRLDQEIVRARRAEDEAQHLRRLVADLKPQQTAPQTPKELEELKEQNPTLYKIYMQQERRLQAAERRNRELGAGQFQMYDEKDKQDLVSLVGSLEEVNKYAPRIEAELQEARNRGMVAMSRSHIYRMIKGDELVRGRHAQKQQPQKTVKADSETTTNAPGSDVSAQVGVSSSASTPREESFEEFEKRILNSNEAI